MYSASWFSSGASLAAIVLLTACASSVPEPKIARFSFPKEVQTTDSDRPYEKLGLVRAKVNFPTLTQEYDEDFLCKNYYNKAARDLLKRAREQGGDAVLQMRTVTFLMDGRTETHSTPQCSDDGSEGQVLVEGIAVKWKPDPEKEAQSKP